VTGQGIDELRRRIRARIERGVARSDEDGFRMPVDRVFSLAGVGTVVTGTTWSGRLAVGDAVRVLPAGKTARIRSIESYGRPAAAALPATRTALGLTGIDRDEIERGDVVVGGLPWEATTALDVEIELLPSAARPIELRSRVRLHLGTAEILARVNPRGRIEPGGKGAARLALESATVARGGDRFVLRSYSPVATIGGGFVLDPAPPRRASWPDDLTSADPSRRAAALVTRRPLGVLRSSLPLLLGTTPADAASAAARGGLRPVADRWVPPDLIPTLEARAGDRIGAHHRQHPDEAGLSLETLRSALAAPDQLVDFVLTALQASRTVTIGDGLIALAGFAPTLAGGPGAAERVLERLERAGL
jgi:selenocysteine-specific elongation factor